MGSLLSTVGFYFKHFMHCREDTHLISSHFNSFFYRLFLLTLPERHGIDMALDDRTQIRTYPSPKLHNSRSSQQNSQHLTTNNIFHVEESNLLAYQAQFRMNNLSMYSRCTLLPVRAIKAKKVERGVWCGEGRGCGEGGAGSGALGVAGLVVPESSMGMWGGKGRWE